jgi:quercetin dioxygenase-like cupin family protein
VNKDETFHVVRGEMLLRLTYKDGKEKTLTMREGDSFHVTPGLMHQFEGISSETWILEFSTEHFEEDSFRVERGD